MTDLVAFIEARLAEDEAHAKKDLHMLDRASNGGAWEYGVGYNLPYSTLGSDGSIGRLTATYGRALADGEPDQHNADAMLAARMVRSARRRAERVLREVEAKRRILAEHQPLTPEHEVVTGCSSCSWRDDWEELHVAYPCATVRLLAAPYSDHPDYRSSWSPESVIPDA